MANDKYNLYYNDKLIGSHLGKAGIKGVVTKTIQHYIENHPNKSYNDLKEMFKHIRNDLILDEQDYEDFKRKPKKDTKIRHVKIEVNSKVFYISNQFGDGNRNNPDDEGNFQPFIRLIESLGYRVETIGKTSQNNNSSQTKRNKSMLNDKSQKKTYCPIKNIILYGPPGVGKTHNYQRLITMIEEGKSAQEIGTALTHNSQEHYSDNNLFETIQQSGRVQFVSFHQSYAYEDFIEGFLPTQKGTIELRDGIFKALCQKANKEANNNSQQNYYMVIDEINRGNISKIFGESITLIEEDKRGNSAYTVTLPYSKEPFSIPANLYIIATMNSSDKSIATIDIALRRRFTFIQMRPNLELIKHLKAKTLLQNLNEYIKAKRGEEYLIGHSYFMGIDTDESLQFCIDYKITPLLQEYFYSDDEGLDRALNIISSYSDVGER